MSTRRYDVVVIGAGVAGLNTAYELSKQGFKVALVESKPRELVGEKACGDAIGLHHFEELGWEPPSNVIDHYYEGVKIYSPSEEHSIIVPGKGISVNRVAMGQWMLKRALDAGVELYEKHTAVRVNVKDSLAAAVEAREAGSLKPVELRASVFIDASGAKPALRTKLPPQWPISEKPYTTDFNIAYREVVELDEPLERDIEYAVIYLDADIAPGGYWWLFPKNSSGEIANIGLGVIWSNRYNPRHNYEKYIRHRFKGKVQHRGGGLVPTRRPLPSLVWRNVVVIGDAAYTVNPIHGGGIGSSLLASHIASIEISRALEEEERVDEESLWEINKRYMLAYGAKQAGLDVLRMFLQKLASRDFEWIIRNRIVSGREVYELGQKASLAEAVVSSISRLIRLLGKPSLLNQLRTVKKYMDRAIALHREEYPDKPGKLREWMNRVERLYDEYRSIIGYNPGERVKW
ncbi:MAG: geranylgeranyl reductase [Thermoprotei archaeon]|nr:MAG: geranylgeranyl reductase [Thermoprotei archaeon]